MRTNAVALWGILLVAAASMAGAQTVDVLVEDFEIFAQGEWTEGSTHTNGANTWHVLGATGATIEVASGYDGNELVVTDTAPGYDTQVVEETALANYDGGAGVVSGTYSFEYTFPIDAAAGGEIQVVFFDAEMNMAGGDAGKVDSPFYFGTWDGVMYTEQEGGSPEQFPMVEGHTYRFDGAFDCEAGVFSVSCIDLSDGNAAKLSHPTMDMPMLDTDNITSLKGVGIRSWYIGGGATVTCAIDNLRVQVYIEPPTPTPTPTPFPGRPPFDLEDVMNEDFETYTVEEWAEGSTNSNGISSWYVDLAPEGVTVEIASGASGNELKLTDASGDINDAQFYDNTTLAAWDGGEGIEYGSYSFDYTMYDDGTVETSIGVYFFETGPESDANVLFDIDLWAGVITFDEGGGTASSITLTSGDAYRFAGDFDVGPRTWSCRVTHLADSTVVTDLEDLPLVSGLPQRLKGIVMRTGWQSGAIPVIGALDNIVVQAGFVRDAGTEKWELYE